MSHCSGLQYKRERELWRTTSNWSESGYVGIYHSKTLQKTWEILIWISGVTLNLVLKRLLSLVSNDVTKYDGTDLQWISFMKIWSLNFALIVSVLCPRNQLEIMWAMQQGALTCWRQTSEGFHTVVITQSETIRLLCLTILGRYWPTEYHTTTSITRQYLRYRVG